MTYRLKRHVYYWHDGTIELSGWYPDSYDAWFAWYATMGLRGWFGSAP